MVLGHEFAGEIVEVGRDVHNWSAGQLVVANPNGRHCGACAQCRAARYNLCRRATVVYPLGVAVDGGMADYVALHPSYLHRLPAGLSTRHGAWVEPLAVAVRAVKGSTISEGDRVAVLGGGPVGQLVVQVLQSRGAVCSLLVEPVGVRRDTALVLGASRALAPEEVRRRLGDGEVEPVDHVLECSGHPDAPQLALDLVEPGGSVRLVGMSPRALSFEPVAAITKEVQISTAFIYVDEFAAAADLLRAGAVDVDVLTSAVLPLESYADAFSALRGAGAAMKVLLTTH